MPDTEPVPATTPKKRLFARLTGRDRQSADRGTEPPAAGPGAADPGWIEHDGSEGYEGWLYHFADGTVVTDDGTPVVLHEVSPQAPSPDPGRTETSQSLEPDAEPSPAPEPSPDPEPSPEPPPEPDDEHEEPDPQPNDEHDAQSDEADETGETGETGEPDGDQPDELVESGERPDDVPAYVAYSPSPALLYVLGAVFVAASVGGVVLALLAVRDESGNGLLRAVALGAIALAAAWLMQGWQPTEVAVRDGVLEVNRGSTARTVDLRDPAVRVETSGQPSSPAWRLKVTPQEGKPIVVRGAQVRRRQFARIVDFYSSHPLSAGRD